MRREDFVVEEVVKNVVELSSAVKEAYKVRQQAMKSASIVYNVLSRRLLRSWVHPVMIYLRDCKL